MNTIKIVFLVFLFVSCQLFAACHVVHEQNIAQEESLAAADLNSELGRAAGEGDVEQVTALLASGAKVDSHALDGLHTPLMRAAYRGHYEVMKILIEAGADVNAAHSTTHTVLYHALESSQLRAEMIQLLLDAGVSMDPSPLFWAIDSSSTASEKSEAPKIMEMLIDAGADVNARDQSGFTPLIYAACRRGTNRLIDILLRSGAEINATVEISGFTALAFAVVMEQTETVRMLIKADADLELPDNSGNTPLMKAKSKGFEEIEKLLTEAGATR
jgi:serine/threonine-protein phosphatase 6 regulatory ankyrin repeat subunit B